MWVDLGAQRLQKGALGVKGESALALGGFVLVFDFGEHVVEGRDQQIKERSDTDQRRFAAVDVREQSMPAGNERKHFDERLGDYEKDEAPKRGRGAVNRQDAPAAHPYQRQSATQIPTRQREQGEHQRATFRKKERSERGRGLQDQAGNGR